MKKPFTPNQKKRYSLLLGWLLVSLALLACNYVTRSGELAGLQFAVTWLNRFYWVFSAFLAGHFAATLKEDRKNPPGRKK